MPGINETKFKVENHVSTNVDWMKMYVIQIKNEMMMNVVVSVKN